MCSSATKLSSHLSSRPGHDHETCDFFLALGIHLFFAKWLCTTYYIFIPSKLFECTRNLMCVCLVPTSSSFQQNLQLMQMLWRIKTLICRQRFRYAIMCKRTRTQRLLQRLMDPCMSVCLFIMPAGAFSSIRAWMECELISRLISPFGAQSVGPRNMVSGIGCSPINNCQGGLCAK